MPQPASTSTFELSNLAPALRNDLQFSLQEYGGQECYLIEDVATARFFRVGIPEYTFISLLDGTCSVRDALAHTAGLLGPDALSDQDAGAICKWLVDSQLATTDTSSDVERLYHTAQDVLKKKRIQKLNPTVFKVPLFNPDRYTRWLTRHFGWLISWPAFAVWLATMGIGAHHLLTHGNAFSTASVNILSQNNLIWLSVAWLLLKVVHESFHALVCRRLGGEVREAGLVFIVCAPIPYVDVTSAWRLRNKWQRIFVSAAGMYAELYLGAVAAIVWCRTAPGVIHQQAYNTMLLASLTTILFNANPLMRFDGYYMLADYLEIPNLYSLGQQYTQYLARRYWLGEQATLPETPRWKRICIQTYGVAAFFWRILVGTCILIAASALFSGAGIVIALVGGFLWLGMPLLKGVKYIICGSPLTAPNRRRFALVTVVGSAAIAALLIGLPEPGGVQAPAIVRFDAPPAIRAPHGGFVKQILVTDGAAVHAGQPLAVLENIDLETEMAELQVQVRQSLLRSRQFQQTEDIASYQIEHENRLALVAQLDEMQTQLARSTVVAEDAGRIVTRDIASLLGRFVEEGETLMEIGDEDHKNFTLAVGQDELEMFQAARGSQVVAYVAGHRPPRLIARLTHVDPRGQNELWEPALGAQNGGPLPVRPTAAAANSTSMHDAWELVEPRFEGTVAIAREDGRHLRAGQLATIMLGQRQSCLGSFLYRNVSDWFKSKWRQARTSSR